MTNVELSSSGSNPNFYCIAVTYLKNGTSEPLISDVISVNNHVKNMPYSKLLEMTGILLQKLLSFVQHSVFNVSLKSKFLLHTCSKSKFLLHAQC